MILLLKNITFLFLSIGLLTVNFDSVQFNQYLLEYAGYYGVIKKINKISPSPSSCLEEIKYKVSLTLYYILHYILLYITLYFTLPLPFQKVCSFY